MDITNSDDLREKIHEIHNFMRNNGIGYGLTSLKTFNLFYGLMKIEEFKLNDKIGLDDEKCKFSYLHKIVNDPDNQNKIIGILDKKTIDMIYTNNENVNSLLAYNIPLDLKVDVYRHLINEIYSINEIEKSSKEQLSGKIYEYFVGRDHSAISELGAYFTNRRIVDFIINKIKPQLKSDGTIPKMIDMFGGSGGFTIGYMNYINNNFKIDWENNLNNIYHFDINEDVLKSARLEFFCLSGGIFPNDRDNVIRTNSFKYEFENEKFDLILTNPPYGGDKIATSAKKEKRDKIINYIQDEINKAKNDPKLSIDKFMKNNDNKRLVDLYNQYLRLKKENKIEIENNKKLSVNINTCSYFIQKFASKYNLTGNDKEACSLMLIMNLLEVNGTAVGVLKEGLFFDSTYKELRKHLLTKFNVKEVISVPSNQFENTTTKTSIIIFTREEEKTSNINFSEIKVNLYEKDEFIEVFNDNTNETEIKLKFNKGDIINVEEIFIKSVSINEILNNENYSLNSKDYNKVSIECGEDFKLVKIKDICQFQNGYAFKTSEYVNQDKGIPLITITNVNLNNKIELNDTTQKFIIENDKYKKYEINKNDLIISLTGKKPNLCKIAIKENELKSYLNQRLLLLNNFKGINNYYFISIFKTYINNYINQNLGNGSNQDNISSEDIINIEIPIPKTTELLEYWESKISTPFMKKQEKEKRLKEVEDEIKRKINDIQDNHNCEEVRLGDIINYINGKKRNTTDGIKNGLYPLFSSSLNIDYYINEYDYNISSLIINTINGSGKFNIHYSKKFCATSNTIIFTTKNIKFIIYIYYYLLININYINDLATGSTKKKMDKNKISNFKIKLPVNKSLIDNLQPLFDEVEELQKEIKELDETYNNYLKELSKSAIKNNEILNNDNDNNIQIQDNNENEIQDSNNEIEDNKSIKSNSSSKQTLEELKEQCKTLGIKGYSKKKKEELIEMIKNHK